MDDFVDVRTFLGSLVGDAEDNPVLRRGDLEVSFGEVAGEDVLFLRLRIHGHQFPLSSARACVVIKVRARHPSESFAIVHHTPRGHLADFSLASDVSAGLCLRGRDNHPSPVCREADACVAPGVQHLVHGVEPLGAFAGEADAAFHGGGDRHQQRIGARGCGQRLDDDLVGGRLQLGLRAALNECSVYVEFMVAESTDVDFGLRVGRVCQLEGCQVQGRSALWILGQYALCGAHALQGTLQSQRGLQQCLFIEALAAEEQESCDLIFLDGAKGQYIRYLPVLLSLLRTGGVLITDNILKGGELLDSRYAVTRRNRTIHRRMLEYLDALCGDPQLRTILLETGDGMAVSVKKNLSEKNEKKTGTSDSRE